MGGDSNAGDIESLRKKRIYDDDEEDEGEILPTEEEFYEALETEVFGDMLPKDRDENRVGFLRKKRVG